MINNPVAENKFSNIQTKSSFVWFLFMASASTIIQIKEHISVDLVEAIQCFKRFN